MQRDQDHLILLQQDQVDNEGTAAKATQYRSENIFISTETEAEPLYLSLLPHIWVLSFYNLVLASRTQFVASTPLWQPPP